MKLVLAKQDFRNSDAWSEVCDTLGLPDNTTGRDIRIRNESPHGRTSSMGRKGILAEFGCRAHYGRRFG